MVPPECFESFEDGEIKIGTGFYHFKCKVILQVWKHPAYAFTIAGDRFGPENISLIYRIVVMNALENRVTHFDISYAVARH